MTPIRPQALRPGDRVAVLAPSSPVFAGPLVSGLAVLSSWGYDVVEGRHLRSSEGHLAGLDQVRLEDLETALADPEIRAVLAGRGGYGAQRLVDLLDWDRFRDDPTLLVGFSDFTALLGAAWTRARVTSIHGQFVGRFDRLTDTASRRLRSLLSGEDPEPVAFEPDQVITGGRARGPLIGGNLSLVATAIGTATELDMGGAVVFLEDVNEPPYAIDRMLTQLLRGGHVRHAAAVVLGEWRGCAPPTDRPSASADEVAAERLADLGIPVVTGLPIGHTDRQLALPYGVECELDTSTGTLSVGAAVV